MFCDMLESGETFSGKNVKLDADIGITRMAGCEGRACVHQEVRGCIAPIPARADLEATWSGSEPRDTGELDGYSSPFQSQILWKEQERFSQNDS